MAWDCLSSLNVRETALVVLSLLETILFGGLIFGWTSLVFVLKQYDIYADLCQTDETNSSSTYADTISTINLTKNIYVNETMSKNLKFPTLCKEQDARLNLFFDIALAASNICTVVVGVSDSRLGSKITRVIFISAFTVGAVIMAFTSKELPWMILPALFLIKTGGFALIITNVRVSFLLKHGSAVYIGLLNGCFDTSADIQWIVKVLHENGITLNVSYIGIAILHVIISGTVTFLFPSSPTKKPKEDNIERSDYFSIQGSDNSASKSTSETNIATDIGRKIDEEDDFILRKSIFLPMFGLHIFWFSVISIQLYYFYGSINYRLEVVLRDEHMVGYFTDVLAYITLGGIVMSFAAGALCEWQKQYFIGKSPVLSRLLPQILPLLICSVIAMVISILEFFSASYVFYIVFVLVVMLRGFLFAINMEYIASVYPLKYATLLLGISSTITGVICLSQYALFFWNQRYDSAYYHVTGLLLVLVILTMAHPLNIYVQVKGHNRKINHYG